MGKQAQKVTAPQPVQNPHVGQHSLPQVLGRAMSVVLVGALVWAVAPLTPWSGGMTVAGVIVVGVGVVTGLVLDRVGRRRERLEALAEEIAPLLGVRAPGVRLRPHRWRRGWVGRPEWIRMRYYGSAPSGDPKWSSSILAAAERCLGVSYRVRKNHEKRHLLDVEVAPPKGEVEASSQSRERLERAVTELLGPTAKMTGVGGCQEDGETPEWFTVVHQAGTKLAAAGYRNRVERTLNAMLPGRWRGLWDLQQDTVRFELRPTLPTSLWMSTEMPTDVEDLMLNYSRVAIPYAQDEDRNVIVWRPAKVPMMLITGTTGVGKTSTTRAIAAEVTKYGWPVWIADGKRVEFLEFRDWPNVQIVASTVPQQVALVHRVWMLMRERFRLMEDEGVQVADFEPLLVILDEWADFVKELLDWYQDVKPKGGPRQPPTLKEYGSINRQARLARIHVITSMQRADVSLFGSDGGEVRSNQGQRLSIGRLDPQGAGMMWGSQAIGVTIPRGVQQRATTTNNDGAPVEAQCYRFPDMSAPVGTEEGDLREAIRPAESRHPRLVIVPPEERGDLDTGEVTPADYWDFADAEWALASQRPDLDPLLRRKRAVVDGRKASSAMAMLGLGDGPETDRGESDTPIASEERPRLRVVQDEEDTRDGQMGAEPELDDYEGYEEPDQARPGELAIGDLIEVDEGSGMWVVVDEMPEEDPVSPGLVAVSWRGDGDEAGALSLSADDPISVRRPVLIDEESGP